MTQKRLDEIGKLVGIGRGRVEVGTRRTRPGRCLIESRDHVSFMHERVEVGAERRDDAGHLSADVDGSCRLQRACRFRRCR